MTDIWSYEALSPIGEPEPLPDPPIGEPEPLPPPMDGEPEPPAAKLHANNGWGNGMDGDNPGTPKGNAEQAGTKQNHFVSDKFVFKFDGR